MLHPSFFSPFSIWYKHWSSTPFADSSGGCFLFLSPCNFILVNLLYIGAKISMLFGRKWDCIKRIKEKKMNWKNWRKWGEKLPHGANEFHSFFPGKYFFHPCIVNSVPFIVLLSRNFRYSRHFFCWPSYMCFFCKKMTWYIPLVFRNCYHSTDLANKLNWRIQVLASNIWNSRAMLVLILLLKSQSPKSPGNGFFSIKSKRIRAFNILYFCPLKQKRPIRQFWCCMG